MRLYTAYISPGYNLRFYQADWTQLHPIWVFWFTRYQNTIWFHNPGLMDGKHQHMRGMHLRSPDIHLNLCFVNCLARSSAAPSEIQECVELSTEHFNYIASTGTLSSQVRSNVHQFIVPYDKQTYINIQQRQYYRQHPLDSICNHKLAAKLEGPNRSKSMFHVCLWTKIFDCVTLDGHSTPYETQTRLQQSMHLLWCRFNLRKDAATENQILVLISCICVANRLTAQNSLCKSMPFADYCITPNLQGRRP